LKTERQYEIQEPILSNRKLKSISSSEKKIKAQICLKQIIQTCIVAFSLQVAQ
jgi:hypothetical protein